MFVGPESQACFLLQACLLGVAKDSSECLRGWQGSQFRTSIMVLGAEHSRIAAEPWLEPSAVVQNGLPW